jgi:hypothetical protein
MLICIKDTLAYAVVFLRIMNEWRGWLISVDSKRPSGGHPVSKLYAARIANPEQQCLP